MGYNGSNISNSYATGSVSGGSSGYSVGGVVDYQTERGWAVVAKLDEIAKDLNTTLSAVALGWLRGHGSVPIASARTVAQALEILPVVNLSPEQVSALDAISA